MDLGKLGRSVHWQLVAMLVIIAGIKGAVLLSDSVPSFFYGDSESYLTVATINWIPADRSFVYGLLLAAVALKAHSIGAMIYMQIAYSCVAAWLLCYALVGNLRARFPIAAVFGILCAIEPLQLLMERYIMTEATANLLFALHFVLLLGYLRRPRWWMLLLSQVAGVAMVTIRISFLPEVAVNSVLVPLLSPTAMLFYRSVRARMRERVATLDGARLGVVVCHLALSVIVSQGLLTQYANWYGSLTLRKPALNYESGAYLIADFAPLVAKQDFPADSHRDATFRRVTIDTANPGLRVQQHFWDGGLWHAIQAEYPDPAQANKVALKTVKRALLRRPFGAVRLAAHTYAGYFEEAEMRSHLATDEGADGRLSPTVRTWLTTLYGLKNPVSYQITATKRWHQAALGWYWVVLATLALSPGLLWIVEADRLRPAIVIVVTALIFLAGVTALVERPTPRYLTTPAWLVLLMFGLAADGAMGRWRGRRPVQYESQRIPKGGNVASQTAATPGLSATTTPFSPR